MTTRSRTASPDRGRLIAAVALLRGINVGGRNRLPMDSLAAVFEDLGCEHVRTYIQSGNVVFNASQRVLKQLASAVRDQIGARCDVDVTVLLRTSSELHAVATGNPFVKPGAPARALHVAFLADLPDPSPVAALDPALSPCDRFIARGARSFFCFQTASRNRSSPTPISTQRWQPRAPFETGGPS